jgi:MFS family permease
MQSPTTGPAVASGPRTASTPLGGKYFALAVLFSMNLLNYVDRYSFFAVGTHVERDLGIDHADFGWLSSSFMIVYTVVSPFMGWLGDRYHRRVLLASGVALWSVATVGTSFSHGYYDMFFWRALLGVGEASYGVIAPALLADLFAPRDRGRAMGAYYLALPLGGALGYGIGGWLADAWGWRPAFWVVGLPGLAAAAAGLMIHDPGRGASEGKTHDAKTDRPRLKDYFDLFRTPTFVFNTAGMAAVTFTTGAYAVFGSTFYQTVRGLTATQAGVWIGGMTAVAGLVGIASGTKLADVLRARTRRAYLLLACAAVVAAIPPGMFAMLVPERLSSLSLMFVAMLLMATVLGPCNTVIADVVPANRRATGFSVYIFLIHLLGDISSPILIGELALWLGRPSVVGSPIGQALAAIGALPVKTPEGVSNLTAGMLSVVPVMALGAFFFLLGSRHLPHDQDRARAAGGGVAGDGALLAH